MNIKFNGKYRNEYIKTLWALSALYYFPAAKTESGLRKRAFTGNSHIYSSFKIKFQKETSIMKKEWYRNLSDERRKYLKEANRQGILKWYREHKSVWCGRSHTEYTKKLIGSKSAIHQAGNKNSQYGTMWITNIATGEDKKIKKTDVIPSGWEKGRGGNIVKCRQAKLQESIIQKKALKKEQWINKLRSLYKKYIEGGGFNSIKDEWESSRPNFLQLCKKYLPEYTLLKNKNKSEP